MPQPELSLAYLRHDGARSTLTAANAGRIVRSMDWNQYRARSGGRLKAFYEHRESRLCPTIRPDRRANSLLALDFRPSAPSVIARQHHGPTQAVNRFEAVDFREYLIREGSFPPE
jgi:hypothetical protein